MSLQGLFLFKPPHICSLHLLQWPLSLGRRGCNVMPHLVLSIPVSHSRHLDFCHPLREVSLMRVERWWIYGYKDKSLGASLILCLFSRMMVVGSPLGPVTFLATDFSFHNGARYGFHLVEWALNARKKVATPMTFMSFLCCGCYLAMIVINAAHRVHIWVRMLITFLLL